jgi:hypothetical protein
MNRTRGAACSETIQSKGIHFQDRDLLARKQPTWVQFRPAAGWMVDIELMAAEWQHGTIL